MTCSSNLLSQISGWVCTTPSSSASNKGADVYNNNKNNNSTSPSTSKTQASSFFNVRGLVEESKCHDDTTAVNTYNYVRNAFQCSGPSRRGVEDATTASDSHNDEDDYDDDDVDDDEQYDHDQQMRRLASWGTFGTIGTTDSLDTSQIPMDHHNNNTSHSFAFTIDDDGNPIDPQIIEKAKQRNRAKLLQQESGGDHNHKFTRSSSGAKPKKRSVKFAYPPITSLKQCPRIDPEELDVLFFSDEELATYEQDRRSTGVVDDVEIVAISTSFSDHETTNNTTTAAPSTSSTPKTNSSDNEIPSALISNTIAGSPLTPKATFRFKSLMMPSPRGLLRSSNPPLPSGAAMTTSSPSTLKLKQRNSFGSSISSSLGKNTTNINNNSMSTPENSSAVPGTSQFTDEPMTNQNHHKNGTTTEPPKRLLKSVQIFLRERSTAHA